MAKRYELTDTEWERIGAVDKRSISAKVGATTGQIRLSKPYSKTEKVKPGFPDASFTILFRLNAVAERRQCSVALPSPRFRVLPKL